MIKTDEYFMRYAIELAKKSRASGNEPFGAVLVKDNNIVMEGKNTIHTLSDPTRHAELSLISDYCQKFKTSTLTNITLYSSCEPCVMCSGAMVWSQLGKLVYSVTHDQLAEIAGSNIMIASGEVFKKSPHQPKVVSQLLNEEGLSVFDDYTF